MGRVHIGGSPSHQTAQGKLFVAGGKVVLGLAGNASLHFENPASSGRAMTIVKWFVAADVKADGVYWNDAASGGTAAANFCMNELTQNTSPAVVKTGSNVLTGGTQLSPVQLIPANVPEEREFLVPVGPGHSFAIQAALSAGGAFYATVVWFDPLAKP